MRLQWFLTQDFCTLLIVMKKISSILSLYLQKTSLQCAAAIGCKTYLKQYNCTQRAVAHRTRFFGSETTAASELLSCPHGAAAIHACPAWLLDAMLFSATTVIQSKKRQAIRSQSVPGEFVQEISH